MRTLLNIKLGKKAGIIIVPFILPFSSFAALASDDFFGDIDVSESTSSEEDNAFSYTGYVLQELKYGVAAPQVSEGFDRDSEGLSQVQTDIFFEARGEFSSSLGWVLSTKYESDWLEWQGGESHWRQNHERMFLKDAYLDATFENGVWVRAGHQVFAWGESEGLAITDVLSPQDIREIGQAELRDIREQVPAVLLSIPVGEMKLNTVVTWDAGHDRFADSSEEFYPLTRLRALNGFVQPSIQEVEKDWELAAKLDYSFNGGDLTFVLADVNDNRLTPSNITLEQKRIRVIGGSGNLTRGNWLFKGEFGRHLGVSDGVQGFDTNQWRAMAGVEFAGWNDWQISYEANVVQVESDHNVSMVDELQKGQVLRVQYDSLNERLTNQWWLLDFSGSNGQILRWDLEYDWSDALSFGVTLVAYENDNESSQFYPFRNSDSLNISAKYSF